MRKASSQQPQRAHEEKVHRISLAAIEPDGDLAARLERLEGSGHDRVGFGNVVQHADDEYVVEIARRRQPIAGQAEIGDAVAMRRGALLQHAKGAGWFEGDDARRSGRGENVDEASDPGADLGDLLAGDVAGRQERGENIVEQIDRTEKAVAVRILRPLFAEVGDGSGLQIAHRPVAASPAGRGS